MARESMNYEYTYLLLGLLFVGAWLYLYWRRRDERREMLVLSSLFAVFGIAADWLYIKDWWHPASVLGTPPFTVEAIIAAFGIIGVGAVLPEYVLRLKEGPAGRLFTHREMNALVASLFTMTALFYGSFYLLGVNSLVATILALAIPTAFMWGRRPDLIRTAVINGFALVAVAAVLYGILEVFTPGWVSSFYLFQNTPAVVVFYLPIDDVAFYFFTGLFFGTFYEWWQGTRRFPMTRRGK